MNTLCRIDSLYHHIRPQKAHVLGEDLPIKMDEPKMANTQSKKELLMTYENGIY